LCIFLYVGSDQLLPELVPLGRDIGVNKATKGPEILALFSKLHVYGIATRLTGDGCGFQGHHKQARKAREGLATFLESTLELEPELELFVAWHEFELPSSFDWIGPSDIRTWISGFKPGTFLLIVREN
jgi:hypothetical protein